MKAWHIYWSINKERIVFGRYLNNEFEGMELHIQDARDLIKQLKTEIDSNAEPVD